MHPYSGGARESLVDKAASPRPFRASGFFTAWILGVVVENIGH